MTEMHDSDRLPKKRIFIARGLALIGGLASGCAGIGRTSAPLAPPITLPVPLHKAGARIETDIRIVEDRSYRFVFPLMFSPVDSTFRERAESAWTRKWMAVTALPA